MSVQSQNSPERQTLFIEDEETEVHRTTAERKTVTKKPEKKTRKHYMKLFFSLLLAAVLGFGTRSAYRHSTLFLEDKVQDGYLPIDQYVVYRDGVPEGNVRALNFRNSYNTVYNIREGVTAPGGITVGSSWDEFVEVYGDLYFSQLYYMPVSRGGYWEYEEMQYIDGNMKVSDFDRDYVKTGVVDLETNGIDIEFSVQYMGRDVMYENNEIYEHLDRYYSLWNELNHSYPRRGEITYRFDFFPPDVMKELPNGGLYEFDVSQFSY